MVSDEIRLLSSGQAGKRLFCFFREDVPFKECKFRLGSYQYRVGKIRFSLEELVKDVERQNVLLEYLRLEKLQVCYSCEEID